MTKIVGVKVSHHKNVSVWKQGVPETESYAEMRVYATLLDKSERLVATIINLDTARLTFKEVCAKRYFQTLIGMSVEEACQQVFSFEQTLNWCEVKECELY